MKIIHNNIIYTIHNFIHLPASLWQIIHLCHIFYINSTVYVGLLAPAFFSIRVFSLLNVSSFRAISSLNAESLKINLIGNGATLTNPHLPYHPTHHPRHLHNRHPHNTYPSHSHHPYIRHRNHHHSCCHMNYYYYSGY